MTPSMRTINVELADRSYDICVGEKNLPELGPAMRRAGLGNKAAIVADGTVAGLYLKPVEASLRQAGFETSVIFLPAGEEHKNLDAVAAIYDRLVAARFERGSVLVALGGGVVGDVTGFAAASYLRGISYVQVPTTLLAQVDSSVGGKTGVNHKEGKNLIGAFHQPRLVWIDVGVLRSLPRREVVAGLAEVIKYGVIADAALFRLLEDKLDDILKLDSDMLAEIVAASCAIKADVVAKDEHESDLRAVLNFGHTVGHALEALTGYETFLHGEAVAIGMVQAAAISVAEGACDRESFERIRRLVVRAGLPAEMPAEVSPAELVKHMEVDKKSAGGKIKFILCKDIGATRFHALAPGEIVARLEAAR
ncbi:MAG TPA: 3-dehydroquinate synthase [Candidatus Binatia bacterium]